MSKNIRSVLLETSLLSLFLVFLVANIALAALDPLEKNTQSAPAQETNTDTAASDTQGGWQRNTVPEQSPPSPEETNGWKQGTLPTELPADSTRAKAEIIGWGAGFIVINVVIVIAILLTILAGYLFIARKNIQKTQWAKKWIKYLSLALLASAIVFLIINRIPSFL